MAAIFSRLSRLQTRLTSAWCGASVLRYQILRVKIHFYFFVFFPEKSFTVRITLTEQCAIMSWQDYVDKQLLASRCVTKAAIAGHDGNVWAKSDGFEITKDELAKIVQGFEKQDILTSSGVTLAGSRYIYLSGTDKVIRAKLGKVGVHCMKTQQAVVVSLYEDPIQPQQAASVVEKLGDYLVSCGY